ncbi:TonB-dependent receptor [Methylobacter sp.]|uniref:TonB-dependent receptor n=1 Tax=Methylobacter sp. TaxID=2051955 RepID=UPI002FDEC53A
MNNSPLFTLSLFALAICQSAYAGNETEKSALDETITFLEDIIIVGKSPSSTMSVKNEMSTEEIAAKQAQVTDTAKLLEDTAGLSFQAGGGVSSLPIIHGLNDNRIKIDVNGMTVHSICPNHMNPALSYIDRTNVGNITVLQGVTPVSMGGDSIAGTISVESAKPEFAEPGKDILLSGKMSSFYRSNGDAFGGSIAAGIANEHVRLDYTGSDTQSRNYKDGNGKVVHSSAYENQNHAAALSFKFDNHLLEIKGGQQHIPYQGFPTARMDLINNDSIFGNVHYKGAFDWGNLDAKLYLENTSHTMDYEADRRAPEPMPMETRGRNHGYKLQAEMPFGEQEIFRFGNEFHSSLINDFWPPTSPLPSMMGPNTFFNLNNATRDRVGTFAEWESDWSAEWKSMLGVRYDHTMTDTGNVQAYNNVTSDYFQALAFNTLDHQRNYDTFDVTALMQFTPNQWSQYNFGYARKNRAPSLHELYPWSISPMQMTMVGWFGDGNGYVGNMNLKPETAHNISFTADFYDPKSDAWGLKVTPYVSYVENFIDADRCNNCRQPRNGFYYLQMANHDARLWGIDVTSRADLFTDKTAGKFSTHSIMSYVNGRRMDGGNLYHMMPFNLKLSLDHERKGWKNTFEMQFVDGKNDVQAIRNELRTPAYVLLNAKTGYQWKNLGIDIGLDNILDKQYYYPLSGVYIGDQNAMTLVSSRPNINNLPGLGRSVYVGMTLTY